MKQQRNFCMIKNLRLRLEAARAIHDAPIPDALAETRGVGFG